MAVTINSPLDAGRPVGYVCLFVCLIGFVSGFETCPLIQSRDCPAHPLGDHLCRIVERKVPRVKFKIVLLYKKNNLAGGGGDPPSLYDCMNPCSRC